jgi:hypothetical protein
MSHDVSLLDENGKPVIVENHSEGGTYVVGGTTEACLNITYNYGSFYYEFLDKEKGLEWLDDKKASETISQLKHAIQELGTTRDSNYWSSTSGNAGYALNILLSWAKQYPNAIWEVT